MGDDGGAMGGWQDCSVCKLCALVYAKAMMVSSSLSSSSSRRSHPPPPVTVLTADWQSLVSLCKLDTANLFL